MPMLKMPIVRQRDPNTRKIGFEDQVPSIYWNFGNLLMRPAQYPTYCSSTVLKLRIMKYTKGKSKVAEMGSVTTTVPIMVSVRETGAWWALDRPWDGDILVITEGVVYDKIVETSND
jgi:hypothetical protein